MTHPAPTSTWPLLGCGVGLRTEHFDQILNERPPMDWFEATTENYMNSGGRPLWVLEQVRRDYPIALHGVSLSIGSVDPLDPVYLKRWKELVDRIEPAMVSDHLCWAGVERKNLHDLLPMPFTEEALDHIVARVGRVQEHLNRRILLENVSSYITYKQSAIPEWEFLSEVSRRSGCGILLDINNIYVNAVNHGFDPRDFVRGVPAAAVGYCHMAGHTNMGKWLFDTHSKPVIEPVWNLYRAALDLFGKKSTLVEWDENVPEWEALAAEASAARKIYDAAPDRSCADVVRSSDRVRSDLGQVGPAGVDRTWSEERTMSEITLAELQHWMRRRIYPDLEEAGAGADAGSAGRSVELNPQAGDSGEDRLQVYADGYSSRIAESLKEVYEAVAHVLGEGMFLRTAMEYAQTRPSRTFDLGQAGRDFAAFLKNARVTEKLPFLPDLAILEWRVMEAFHASDPASLDPARLAGFAPEDWEDLVFEFKPSVTLVRSAWPVTDIWRARRTPVEEMDLDLTNRPQNVLVHRIGFKVACAALEPEEFRVLQGLRAGRTLGSVCDELVSDLPENGDLPLEVWFGRWSNLGLFTSAHTGKPYDSVDSLLR